MNENDREGDVDLVSPQKPHFQNHFQMLQWTLCHESKSLQPELLKEVPNDFELKLLHLQLPLLKNGNRLRTLQSLLMMI